LGLVSRVMLVRKLLGKLYFLSYRFGEHWQAILNFELIDLAMPHLTTEADELDPRGM
jgi:hypothetical protein